MAARRSWSILTSAGRKELPLPGMPHLGSGISWERDGRRVMATPHLNEPRVTVIDVKSWEPVKRIETAGPGFFLRGHENSPYVWADVFTGPNKDTVHVIDRESLEIVKTLKPEPGRTAGHVEFTRDGRYALLSSTLRLLPFGRLSRRADQAARAKIPTSWAIVGSRDFLVSRWFREIG
jgi:hypothetical protein